MSEIKVDMELKRELSKKINSLIKSIHKIDKISSNEVVSIVKDQLEESAISILPEIKSYEENKIESSVRGGRKSIIKIRVYMEFEIVDTESGYSVVKSWIGASDDRGTQSLSQLITKTVNQFYCKFFQINSKEENLETLPNEERKRESYKNKVVKKVKELIDKRDYNEINCIKYIMKNSKELAILETERGCKEILKDTQLLQILEEEVEIFIEAEENV